MDVIVENTPAYAKMRVRLRKLFATVETALVSHSPKLDLDPLPKYDEENATGGNTEIVMLSNLRLPEERPTANLDFSSNLMSCLRWAGPHCPLKSYVRNQADKESEGSSSLTKCFQHGLNLRYLAVVRLDRYDVPQPGEDNMYHSGAFYDSVFFVDLKDDTILGSFKVDGHAARKFNSKKDESGKKPTDSAAYSSVWTDTRKKVIEGLKDLTGGDFKYRTFE